jgi:hypothetical protein
MTNLVTNPGAETGDMAGWVVSGATSSTGWIASALATNYGSYGFITYSTAGTMSQKLPLTPGVNYFVSININGYYCENVALSIGENVLISKIDPYGSYALYTATYMATNTLEILKISGTSKGVAGGYCTTDEISITILSNLVTNPGAETGDMVGWVVSETTSSTGWIASALATNYGSYGFITYSAAGTMSQNLSLTPGVNYFVSINMNGYYCKNIALSIGENVLISKIDPYGSYALYTATYMATNTLEILKINGTSNGGGAYCTTDEISVIILSNLVTNLVTNPGAETGDMAGWVVSGTTSSTGWIASALATNYGSYGFITYSTAGTMSQNLFLMPEVNYFVSININGYYCENVALSIGENVLISKIDPYGSYALYTATYMATNTLEILKISGTSKGGAGYCTTDEISVTMLSDPPTSSPTISSLPTTTPTFIKTLIPIPTPLHKTSTLDDINNIISGRVFQIIFPIVSFFSSLVAGWFLRNKIAFYVLNNWGYSCKLIYNDDSKCTESYDLQIDEVGLRLESNKLFCTVKSKNIAIEVNNGNNAGISSGLYEIIAQELTKQSSKPFTLIQSEKNQIRDFLLSHGFVSTRDLGCIRGTVYNICLNNYKTIHREKYAQQIRIDQSPINQNPLHEQTDSIESGSDRAGDIELRETFTEVLESSVDSSNSVSNKHTITNKENCVLLSIDAMMDPERVRLQNEEFIKFISYIMNFINKELPKDVTLLLSSNNDDKSLLLEPSIEKSQAVTIYQESAPIDNHQSIESNNFVLYLLNAKQILHNLPLLHYVAQNSINYLGYNVSLPDPLEYKEMLISVDLLLGNAVAQYLPVESIMNGMLISTASTASYAVRLTAADYLKNQEPSEEPIEFAQQCFSTIAAYSLPGVVNHALTKAILPDSKMSISTLDMLGSSSFGVVQCYNNYKVVYGTKAQATTTDIVVPYIADAITLWSLRSYFSFDTSSTANLMMSVKNAMSVAATTYAVHCISSMVMDVVPQGTKEGYSDPAFNFASNALNDVATTCYQSATDVSAYIVEEVALIMDYIGAMDLREDV